MKIKNKKINLMPLDPKQMLIIIIFIINLIINSKLEYLFMEMAQNSQERSS